MVYLLHFDRPYRHARHFMGAVAGSPSPSELLAIVERQNHIPILRAAIAAGVSFIVARTWDVDELRAACGYGHGGRARICPVCLAERLLGRAL